MKICTRFLFLTLIAALVFGAHEAAYTQADLIEATVTGVVDGDTIEVEIDGAALTVKMAGIEAPELDLFMCYAIESAEYVTSELVGQTVWLQEYDRANDLLTASAFLDSEGTDDFGASMVSDGWVVALSARYGELEDSARLGKIGFWDTCFFVGFEEIQVAAVDYTGDDEVVELLNVNDDPVDITDWTLLSMPWSDESQRCPLPSMEVGSGRFIEIHTGPAAEENPPRDFVCSEELIWDDDGDTAWVLSWDGLIYSRLAYKGGYRKEE